MAQILVVDDNLLMRKNIKSIVENLGHEVIGELETGNEILNNYKKYQPDIVTLDIVMPGIDGMNALKKLKAEFPKAKVIMISVLGEKSKIIKAIKLGAEYYIQKPIEVKEMCRAINEALDGKNSNQIAKNKCAPMKYLEENIKASLKDELTIIMEQSSEKVGDEKLNQELEGKELDFSNNSNPIEVNVECDRFKIKVNQNLNKKLLESIDDIVKGFLVVEPLKISFDLSSSTFSSDDLEKRFEKIVRMIKVIGGEVEVISS